MPRPKTNPDLIKSANEQFEKMWNLVDSMPDESRMRLSISARAMGRKHTGDVTKICATYLSTSTNGISYC
ncbi:MAG: ClbS/DfsB family four-helix bundle protein [Clostridiales bacterium]|nr:ClbS/DfsB family four-helix bundle protein [Clostridiales bacterium]